MEMGVKRIKVSEFLKMTSSEMTEHLRKTAFSKTEFLGLFGWSISGLIISNKVLKKLGRMSIFMDCHVGTAKEGIKKITIWTIDDHKAEILIRNKNLEVISRKCGKNYAKGNRLVRITSGKSFWDYKKKKWRWEGI